MAFSINRVSEWMKSAMRNEFSQRRIQVESRVEPKLFSQRIRTILIFGERENFEIFSQFEIKLQIVCGSKHILFNSSPESTLTLLTISALTRSHGYPL